MSQDPIALIEKLQADKKKLIEQVRVMAASMEQDDINIAEFREAIAANKEIELCKQQITSIVSNLNRLDATFSKIGKQDLIERSGSIKRMLEQLKSMV